MTKTQSNVNRMAISIMWDHYADMMKQVVLDYKESEKENLNVDERVKTKISKSLTEAGFKTEETRSIIDIFEKSTLSVESVSELADDTVLKLIAYLMYADDLKLCKLKGVPMGIHTRPMINNQLRLYGISGSSEEAAIIWVHYEKFNKENT